MALDLSRLNALCAKALKQHNAGGFARASAYFAEAVEAAQALQQPADCMNVASLQTWQAYATVGHCRNGGMADSERLLVLRKMLPLLDAAAATLKRRRAVVSLRSEGLRPAENAFALAFTLLQYKHAGHKNSGADVAVCAGLTIYTTYVRVATCMMHIQIEMAICSTLADEAASNLMPEVALQQIERYDFVASALDLIAEPRTETQHLHVETELVEFVEKLAKGGRLALLSPSMGAAWERLQRSGVIEERGLLSTGIDALKKLTGKVVSAATAKAAARGLRNCALAACAAREVEASQFKNCGACQTVVYCCREHQVADWPAHKAACKAARKASAASAAPSEA